MINFTNFNEAFENVIDSSDKRVWFEALPDSLQDLLISAYIEDLPTHFELEFLTETSYTDEILMTIKEGLAGKMTSSDYKDNIADVMLNAARDYGYADAEAMYDERLGFLKLGEGDNNG